MSVTSVTLLARRGAEKSASGMRYRATYQVLTNDPLEAESTILGHPDIPVIGSLSSADPFSAVESVDAQQDENDRTNWTVTATYSPLDGETEEKQLPPEQRRVKRSWRAIPVEKVATVDIDGNQVMNTAGIYFDPPPIIVGYHAAATFQRYERTFTTATAMKYVGSVNSVAWGEMEAGKVKCTDIQADEVFENGEQFWLVTYEFEADPDGFDAGTGESPWDLIILNNGTMVKATGGTGYSRIRVNSSGNYVYIGDAGYDGADDVTEPVPINAGGTAAISSANLPELALYQVYVATRKVDFNELGLPI